ncbi:MAG: hypothetical protein K9K75_02890 [Deltaproteobacteria bacterium]|nr:hypothetical protein [Deltaproteobacteria bacterium]
MRRVKFRQTSGSKSGTEGFALVAVLVVLLLIFTFIFYLYIIIQPALKTGYNFFDSVDARYQTEAGMAQLIAKIRSENLSLPPFPGAVIVLGVDVEEGFAYNSSVTVTNIGANRYRAQVVGFGGLVARGVGDIIFASLPSPHGTDGAVCVYSSGSSPAVVVGVSSVLGNDYKLPSLFSCRHSGCAPVELATFNSVPSIYNSSSGGVINNQQDLLMLNSYIATQGIPISATQVGTREEPLITRIPDGQSLVIDADGAGLLIVGNNSQASFAAGVHFEGLVLLMGNANISGGTNNHIYGTVIFVSPPAGSTIILNGTKPNIVYSSEAFANLKRINRFLTKVLAVYLTRNL